jgi:hypothetical protein
MNACDSEATERLPQGILVPGESQNIPRNLMVVGESKFSELPAGVRVKLRFLSFSRLQSGDFVLVGSDEGASVRRFISIALNDGCTRLSLVDGEGFRSEVPFTVLLGRIDEVLHVEGAFNPNPGGFLQRVAFRLRCCFANDRALD